MLLLLGITILCVLAAVAMRRPAAKSHSNDTLLGSFAGLGRSDIPVRPEASPWSKQVAVDMLNEVVISDEREKVLNMLRRAVQPAEAASANSTSSSSSTAKPPIA